MGISIGSVHLPVPVVLAPMSGVTDLPFRRIAKRMGAGMVVSEMIASGEAIRRTRETLKKTARAGEDGPMAVQLAGHEPAVMAEAARLCAGLGADIIDINFGCPAKKVTRKQCGAAIMRDPRLAARIMEAVVDAVALPVTMKMRTGWDESDRNAPELARIAEACGIRMLTVHGRTRSQFYTGTADWRFIRRVKQTVSIPVLANGDILSVPDIAACLAASGADGVMIGRGACGRPWFLGQAADWFRTGASAAQDPPLAERLAVVREHFAALIEHHGPVRGVRLARKHLAWYAAGLPGAAGFRATVNRLEDPEQVRRAIAGFFEPEIERGAA